MKKRTGFTFIELLVIIAIIGLGMAIALPNYQYLIQSTKINITVQKLYRTIQLSRMEAMKHRSIVTICGSSQSQTCDHQWNLGYLIFKDMNGNGQKDFNEPAIKFRACPKNVVFRR